MATGAAESVAGAKAAAGAAAAGAVGTESVAEAAR